jgi:cytochrome c-type biogenesis protein CcmH
MISPLLLAALVVLGLAALGVVIAPLLRRERAEIAEAGFDRAVYRDQLQEVDRDIARGLLAPGEAASARLEIERRLLAAGPADTGTARPTRPTRRLTLFAGALVVVIATWAAGLYLERGSPDLPDLPFASRGDEADTAGTMPSDIEGAATRLEAKLEADGGDADGWMLLARTESALRHWGKAANAYRHLLGFAPEEAKPGIAEVYGEMLVLAADGVVTPDASAAFAITLARKPDSQIARYYVALADAQAGNMKQAIDAWVKLAGELTADSTMRSEIEKRVADAAKVAGIQTPPLPPPVVAAKP